MARYSSTTNRKNKRTKSVSIQDQQQAINRYRDGKGPNPTDNPNVSRSTTVASNIPEVTPAGRSDNRSTLSPLPQTSRYSTNSSIVNSPLPETPSYQSSVRVTPRDRDKDLIQEKRKAVLAPSRKKIQGREKVRKELADKRTITKQLLADELNKQIDLTLDIQPPNNNNPVIKSNQYTKGAEYVSAIGKDYIGFYNELEDGTTLMGRGRLGDIPTIKPERLVYPLSEVLPELVQDAVEKEEAVNRNPDFGLTIPSGHPLGVGATHQSSGRQYYNCPPDVPVTHPIVERCVRIDRKITNELLK